MSEEIIQNNKIPKPDPNIPWQAMIMTKVVITQPLDNGMWQLVCSFDDNYNLILDGKTHDEATNEVINELKKIKEKWEKEEKVVGLKNLLLENIQKIKEGEKDDDE